MWQQIVYEFKKFIVKSQNIAVMARCLYLLKVMDNATNNGG
jgi:hypothetical protein